MQGLVVALFHSSTNTHLLHLQTQNYAEHIALQSYYDGIVPLVDRLVETVQGQEGILKNYPTENTDFSETMSSVEYLSRVAQTFEKGRKVFPEHPHIQSILDNVGELIYSTIYKLQYLR